MPKRARPSTGAPASTTDASASPSGSEHQLQEVVALHSRSNVFEPRLHVSRLKDSPTNPRGKSGFHGPLFDELVDSVRENGVVQPILVRPKGGNYEIVFGHRRVAAATKAGVETVPAMIAELDDRSALELQILENAQRADLHPLEEAQSLEQLILHHGYDPKSLSLRCHRPLHYIHDRLRLLGLIGPARTLFLAGDIGVGHAVELAKISAKDQARVIDEDGPLFEEEHTLFDPRFGAGEEDEARIARKAITPRELHAWIDEHVRFDAKAPDPVLFPDTAQLVVDAAAEKRRVVPITFSNFIPPEAREGRTFGPKAWKRADGEQKSKRCEYSVLGFVAIGAGRGESFDVCVNKDKCEIHWGQLIKARASNAKSAGGRVTKKQATKAVRREADWERRTRMHREAGERVLAAAPKILAGLAERLPKLKAGAHSPIADWLARAWSKPRSGVPVFPRGKSAEDFLRWLVYNRIAVDVTRSHQYGEGSVVKDLRVFGFDVRPLIAPPKAAKPAKPKAAKKTRSKTARPTIKGARGRKSKGRG